VKRAVLALAGWLAMAGLPVAGGAQSAPFLSQRPERVGSRLVEISTPYTEGRGNLEIKFGFRMAETVQDGSVHDLWGIDSGADVGIGLVYGVRSRLDLELYRSSFLETYELAAKLQLLDQSHGRWASVALRAGTDSARGATEDRERPFGQLLLARRLGNGVTLLVAPSYVSDTPRLRNAFNVPIGLTLPFLRGSLLKIEVVPENRDLDSSVLGWRLALSKATRGHLLELTLGNSRATTVDQILGGDFAAGFARDDVRLGINVVRYFQP
jgi:hypothetical protein